MNKYKIIALMGEAGSGKDTILKEILKKHSGLHGIVSCTTRPPRENEVNGKDYIFLSKEEFAEKVLNLEMLEAVMFREWFYGTSFDSLDSTCVNIGVFNPEGIYALLEYPNIDLTVYYLQTSPKTRLIRQLNRETYPDIEEIIRRYYADNKDFLDLDFPYKILSNENLEDLEKAIETIIGSL